MSRSQAVLIFPAGMPRSIEFLGQCQREQRQVIGASSLAYDPSRQQCPAWLTLPYINHDGFEIISNESKGKFDLIILDEAAVMRNPGTARFKCLRRYLDACINTRLWMMTGTPTPNEPTDAWRHSAKERP